jgi:small subunit ribosomal protein S13
MAEEKTEKTITKKEEIKGIMRLFGTDIRGEKKLMNALRDIKGLSFSFSNAVIKVSELDPEIPIGKLSDKDIEKIKKILENPMDNGIPEFLYNRKKDPVTGDSTHLLVSNLDIQKREDINRMKKLGSYRGIRHRRGLPVRGQRTRSSFRSRRTVGVSKKKIRGR